MLRDIPPPSQVYSFVVCGSYAEEVERERRGGKEGQDGEFEGAPEGSVGLGGGGVGEEGTL